MCIRDRSFKITPFSFFQTNSLGAEVLYNKVREYIGDTKGRLVYDLYSGTGTIAQILAPVADKVIGVEIVEEAVAAARENAGLNGLDNCRFIAGDVLKVLDGIEEKPDLIILDPPREGIHPKALPKIIEYQVCLLYTSVVLMTLHSAKGLEFEKVILSGMEDGLFPSSMSINSDDPTDLEEERRLAYVGITRAKKELTITAARQRMVNGETRWARLSLSLIHI